MIRSAAHMVGILFLILIGALVTSCAREEPELVLRAADDHELSYPTTQGLVRMAELIEERNDGRIRVRLYPQAQLGSERETIRMTQEGTIDINRVNINLVTTIAPALKALALPYIFEDIDHMHAVLDGEIGRELLEELTDSDLIGLGYYDSGQRSFYSSAGPIRAIEDLQGLRIRVQRAQIMEDMVRAVAAVPVRMVFEDVYTGLRTGVIHGAENNFPSWITKGHFEVARYYTVDAHVRTPEIILFSKKSWDTLSVRDQTLIRRAAPESIPYQRRLWERKFEDSIAKAREAECEIITGLDREPFVEAMESVYRDHAAGLMGYVERIRAVVCCAHDTVLNHLFCGFIVLPAPSRLYVLRDYVRQSDVESFRCLLKHVRNEAASNPYHLSMVKALAFDLKSTFYLGLKDIERTQTVPASVYAELETLHDEDTFAAFCERLVDILSRLRVLLDRSEKGGSDTVHQYMAHLRLRFSDPNLSLESVAEYFEMSPASFSRSFKKAIHMGFLECLTFIRIEEAKKRLRKALAVGYQKLVGQEEQDSKE